MESETDKEKPKKKQIVVRDMEIDDLASAFHLGEKLFTAKYMPNLYRTWDEHEVVEFFDTDREFCLVAEIDDRMVGFALGTTIEKARSAWKYGLLVWLGVEPAFQKLGVAAKLFNHFKERMTKEGVRMLIVDTEADNLSALHFFRKMGFGKPEEHIYLSLNLAGQKKTEEKKGNGSG